MQTLSWSLLTSLLAVEEPWDNILLQPSGCNTLPLVTDSFYNKIIVPMQLLCLLCIIQFYIKFVIPLISKLIYFIMLKHAARYLHHTCSWSIIYCWSTTGPLLVRPSMQPLPGLLALPDFPVPDSPDQLVRLVDAAHANTAFPSSYDWLSFPPELWCYFQLLQDSVHRCHIQY